MKEEYKLKTNTPAPEPPSGKGLTAEHLESKKTLLSNRKGYTTK
jgi:hypothetical protein